jgi:nucleoside-diphosphate-sugar epimerase
MNVLLTGARGGLGSPVCRFLVEAGHDVRAVDKEFTAKLPVRLEVVDLLHRETCYRLTEGQDAVVHLANHPRYNGHDPERIFNENVTMNMNVFQAAVQTGVKQIVFASSIQVVTGLDPDESKRPPELPPYLPFDGDLPANPGNPYALSKHVSEQMLRYFSHVAGINTVAIRFPVIIRPEWIPYYLKRHHWINSDPQEGFTFLMSADAASLINAILKANPPGFRTYLPAATANGFNREFFPNVPLRRPVEQMDGFVDIAAITRDTGWKPQFNELPTT